MPSQFAPIWTARLPSDGVGGVAVADGLVIVGCRDPQDAADVWLAFNAATGEQLWRVVYPALGKLDYGNSPRATPLIADGVAYLASAHGQLHAVKIATGAVAWKVQYSTRFSSPRLEWGHTGSPLIADGKLIIQPGGKDASLVALDPQTGETIWKSPGARPGHASFISATMGSRAQLIGYDAESLGGWDPASGERLWTIRPRAAGDFNVPTPIQIDPHRLFVCTENNGARIYRFNDDGAPGPEPECSFDQLNPDSHTPVASRGRIYAVSGGLYCLDVERRLGEIWFSPDRALADYSSLIVAGRRVLAYTQTAELVLFEDLGESGRVVSRLSLGERGVQGVLSHPALVGDRLYARFGQTLACLQLGDVD